jgi:GH24 family phage-related lysozyme (muramidase)
MNPTTTALLRAIDDGDIERIADAARAWRKEDRPDLDDKSPSPLRQLMVPILHYLTTDGDPVLVGAYTRASKALEAIEAGDEVMALRAAESIWSAIRQRVENDREVFRRRRAEEADAGGK